ncbi:hypothetical protein NPIL_540721 [Nephila pilipes]|uniref:Uncharacterized protein n=1 Tax=Nephila pilipes TaxID=299642 RepID=A0A8X6TWD5_NEPPI|nr:hypothetical protein NPIL_540721 [Nephila pilipes]
MLIQAGCYVIAEQLTHNGMVRKLGAGVHAGVDETVCIPSPIQWSSRISLQLSSYGASLFYRLQNNEELENPPAPSSPTG